MARLKRGDFTPQEFQDLCHKFQEADRQIFCDGCENYQITLFGSSPITELKTRVARLLAILRRVQSLISPKTPLADEISAELGGTAKPALQTDEQLARSRAKSLLADGKWSHNHYDAAGMEDIVARIILSAIERSQQLSAAPK